MLVPISTHGNLDLLLALAQKSHARLVVRITPHFLDLNGEGQIKDKTFSLSFKRRAFVGFESHLSYFKTLLECFILFLKSNKWRGARLKAVTQSVLSLGGGQ